MEGINNWSCLGKKCNSDCEACKEKHSKPPLGVKPRYIIEQDRVSELESAFLRFSKANKGIPPEWVLEYMELAPKVVLRRQGYSLTPADVHFE
jgi:hypothetical protein